MNNIDLVKNNQAMIKSGALTIHNPMWDKIKAKLEHMRIRAGTPLPEMKHLLNINGVNCFPRGDLVAISGKEKCGKTTDCRIIVSALMKGEYMGVTALEKNVSVLWIDTEQAWESAEIVLECMRLSSGVSAEQARKKGLTERPPCCVCCILHQNKPKDDNNMRGHLGTELSNKAGEVWEATQDDDHVFSFAQTRSRTRPVDTPLRYKVVSRNYVDIENQKSEEIGIPQLWEPMEADTEEEVEKVKNFKTNFGWKPMTQETANMMFYTIMGYADWNFNTMKAKFVEYWGVSYPMFGKLYSMTDHHVYDVMVNGIKIYRYNGPKFD